MGRWRTGTRRCPPDLRLRRPGRSEARAQTREMSRHRRALVLGQRADAGDVHLVHARALAGCGLVELAQQVSIMLAGETRQQRAQVALGQPAMAAFAVAVVDDPPLLPRCAVRRPGGAGRRALEALGISRDVEQVLRARELVPGRGVLHLGVPAAVVTEVHELLHEHRDVLAGDYRYGAVCAAAAVGTVALRASREQYLPARDVRIERDGRAELGDRRLSAA